MSSIISRLKENTTVPVIVAPMFLVSGVELVLESCRNGVIGTIPSLNFRSVEEFEQALQHISDERQKSSENETKLPLYGINLIVNKTNSRLQPDVELCIKYKVPFIITSLGLSSEVINAIHSYGGIVFHDVINSKYTKKAIEAGVDGIIAISGGAGGHAGKYHPFALIDEIRSFYDGPLVLGGAINNGKQVKAVQNIGADFAYMGTRFIATQESNAFEEYKKMIVDSDISDIIYTDKVSGVFGNFLKKSIENAGIDLTDKEEDIDKMLNAGSKAWKDVWSAGQGVAGIDKVNSVKEMVDEIVTGFRE